MRPRFSMGAQAGVVALTLVAMGASLMQPADAAGTSQQDIEALLAEIERLPKEAFEKNPRQWQEVFDLLQQYVAAAQPVAPRAAPLGHAAVAQRFPALFRELAMATRELPLSSLAGRVLHNGLSTAPLPGQRAAAARDSAASIDELARAAGVALPSSAELSLLMRQVEAANARKPNAAALNQGMREAVAQLKMRAGQHGQTLARLQRAGAALSQRIAVLESLVQRSAAAGGDDALADAARIAQLRAELASLRAQQDEELLSLGAHDVIAGHGAAPASQAMPPQQAPLSRAALVKELHQAIESLREQDADPAWQAVRIGQYELYLAALDALAREELVKAAALRHGERAQDQLMQVSAETRRLAGGVDRGSAK